MDVVDRDAKYKAKQVVDTFLVRSGDVLAAGLVFVGTAIGLATRAYAAIAFGLVLIWIGVLVGLATPK